jgi:hypothetical protein
MSLTALSLWTLHQILRFHHLFVIGVHRQEGYTEIDIWISEVCDCRLGCDTVYLVKEH